MKSKQLYIVTGKGGAGKTTLSLALSLILLRQGKKIKYHCFDQAQFPQISNQLQIPILDLAVEESMKIYVGRKLHSDTIASMVLKAPFFKSTFSMIPGLGQMILLGHIIDLLEKDPDLIIVLDSPSSGHAMTMLDSMQNFKNIFHSGILVKDINRMENFIYNQKKVEIIISSLPTNMAMNESLDLKNFFQEKGIKDISIVLNESLNHNDLMQKTYTDLPFFLKKKIENETEVLRLFNEHVTNVLPYIFKDSSEQIIINLAENISFLNEASGY